MSNDELLQQSSFCRNFVKMVLRGIMFLSVMKVFWWRGRKYWMRGYMVTTDGKIEREWYE